MNWTAAGIRAAVAEAPDPLARAAAEARLAEVIRPYRALGRIDELAVWLAAWQATGRPHVDRPAVVVFVADHGVTVEGVSAYPAEVTAQMLAAFRGGHATVNRIAEVVGAPVTIVDVGVGRPTANLADGPAMTPGDLGAALDAGAAAVDALDTDMIALGEMGIGNSTAAAAVTALLYPGPAPEAWVGEGSGLDEAGLARKQAVVARAVRVHAGHSGPLDILRRAGGRELAALAGAIVAARRRRIPVLLDGFIVTAAAAAMHALDDTALDHCLAAHVGAERGHRPLLGRLGMEPLFDFGLRLGEGTGATLAIAVLRTAARSLADVPTFAEAGVADRAHAPA